MGSVARFRGTLVVSGIGVEYTIVEFPDMDKDYIVAGLIDSSSMDETDAVEISLYMAVDGVNRRCVYKSTYHNTYPEEVIYLRPTMAPRDGKVKITLKQTSGTPKSFPFWIIGFPLYYEDLATIAKIIVREIV